jgi:nickel transport protein
MHVAFTRRWLISLLSAALWVVFCAGPAWAHKVTIFAWVEGDTVYTQSKFSGGKRVKNSTVVVYDKEGNQLLEGKTDENGEFSFQVPKKTDLKVVLKASMGHLAEWTIPADEITGVAQAFEDSAPEVSMEAVTEEPAALKEAETSQPQPLQTAVGLSRQEVQALIDDSLDRKLAPILSMLADARDPGPRLSEVIGGIGYIFGLVGVALYFSSRGKRK